MSKHGHGETITHVCKIEMELHYTGWPISLRPLALPTRPPEPEQKKEECT